MSPTNGSSNGAHPWICLGGSVVTGPRPEGAKAVCIAGGAGFIGSHLGKRLKSEGWYVVAADWKTNEFMAAKEFCDVFAHCDLRRLENCAAVSKGCEQVYNMAADMGGMGFIESNQSVLMFNNTMISSNMLEASRHNKVARYLYASTACVYNETKQMDTQDVALKESDAWPAQPQDTYGLEKLYHEEMCIAYGKDFPIATRMARFHNVYGPRGTWKGGREKAPAAFCRKALASTVDFEMWGDGEQTRSFMFIEDCVEGCLRIMNGECDKPLNLGTEEMISMNEFGKLAMSLAGKDLPIRHIPGPQGVRGRNSDNTMIRAELGWEPLISIRDGMTRTIAWIKEQMEKDGGDAGGYSQSHVVVQTVDSLELLTN
ncbi:nad-dependent epimerase/dehydratase [Tribonema minus]|uniref:Nad-dependent epimerase/dehydratase n=1 Tax=Tribonema minus TaxID=303371 RepID=A0A836CBP2_9STRA|nr:nad-dependent epimerase/dehydratase [Tribonema minus]